MEPTHTIHLEKMYIELDPEGYVGFKIEECYQLIARVSILAHERGLKYQEHPFRFQDDPSNPSHTIDARILDIFMDKSPDNIDYITVYKISIMEEF